MGTLLSSILTALFSAIGNFFLQRVRDQEQTKTQRELERLQLANNALTTAAAQQKQREDVTDAVAHLSDSDLFKQLSGS